jgi:HPP family
MEQFSWYDVKCEHMYIVFSSSSSSSSSSSRIIYRGVFHALGIAYCIVCFFCNQEVWLMNESRTALYRPEAGWWIDPIYHSGCDLTTNCQICRLTNRRRKDYVAPVPLAPGCGLPGALWQMSEEAAFNHFHRHHQHFRQPSSASSGFRQAIALRDLFRGVDGGGGGGGDGDNAAGTYIGGGGVAWREVRALAEDPDQPWNARLQLLAGLGLGWAAAVALRNPDPYAIDASTSQGIVIFMAREGVNERRLLNATNESYLVSASNLIAAALAMRGPRHEVIRERRAEIDSAIRRVRAKILNTRLVGKTLTEVVRENEAKGKQQDERRQGGPDDVAPASSSVSARLHRCGDAMIRRCTTTLKKMKGANVKPPPTFSWYQTFFTFFGVWITLLMLCFWSQYMTAEYGAEYQLALAPFGAMVTLLYGLTAAPASQPKNAILGQLIAVSISLAFTYAEDMHPHLRTSLATAIAVSAMVKFGCTHPPAGASAVFFSTGGGLLGWTNMAVLLVGNVLAIAVATVVNNLSDRRQYPTYWGFGTVIQFFRPLDDEEVLKSSARRGFFRIPLRLAGPSNDER